MSKRIIVADASRLRSDVFELPEKRLLMQRTNNGNKLPRKAVNLSESMWKAHEELQKFLSPIKHPQVTFNLLLLQKSTTDPKISLLVISFVTK